MSGFSIQQGQIRGALVSAGLPADAATRIANVLGNAAQAMRHAGPVTIDTTPRDMRMVTPDTRRHTLPQIDHRPADADYKPSQVASSEGRKTQEQASGVVLAAIAPQQSDAAFRVRSGAYTEAIGGGDSVSVGLRVAGVGEAAFLDPQGNTVVAKNLRVEASPEAEGRLRFSLEKNGLDVVWKIQLQNLANLEVVTDVRYEPGTGLIVTYQNIVAWRDAGAWSRTATIPVSNAVAVSSVYLATDAIVAQRSTLAVFGQSGVEPSVIPVTKCEQ